MARNDPSGLSGAALDRWYRRSSAQIEEERQRALQAGRNLWNAGTRAAQNVMGRTQAELEAIGRGELGRQVAEAGRHVAQEVRDPRNWQEAGAQANAAVRAAANRMTFGGADHLAAGADALFGGGDGETLGRRYRSNLDREHEQDAYDAQHRGVADAAGGFAGDALLFKGAGGAAAHGVSRLPPRAKGAVGEVLSAGKTVLSGDWPAGFQVDYVLKSGKKSVIDHLTSAGRYVEAKFGPYARLSRRQLDAQAELGELYRVDRWQPHHVGRIAGVATAGGAELNDDESW